MNIDKILSGYSNTCSIFSLKDDSVTFIRKAEYLKLLESTSLNILLIIPFFINDNDLKNLPVNVTPFRVPDNIEYYFTLFHNEIMKNVDPIPDEISTKSSIHSSAIIGVDGRKYVTCPDGTKLQMKHCGNVIIEDDVIIDPIVVIHRSSMSSTIIKKGAKICTGVNIGHNVIVGENTVICPGCLIGGTCIIGKNVFIGQGVIVRDHRNICDNSEIGQGSNILNDIDVPGTYVGNPAKFIKKYSVSLKPYDKRRLENGSI